MMKSLIKNGTVVNHNGERRADVLIEHGMISCLEPGLSEDEVDEVIDAEGCYVMPGGVDVHTHFNIDVGLARSCDDFLPAPARRRVAVQQPLSTIWALALRAALCITSWRPTTATLRIRQ